MDSATPLARPSFNPLTDVRLKDWDFALGFLGLYLVGRVPTQPPPNPHRFLEIPKLVDCSWKAEIEFHWRNTWKRKFFHSHYS